MMEASQKKLQQKQILVWKNRIFSDLDIFTYKN